MTANIASVPAMSFLSNTAVDLVHGHAVFEGLVFSHPALKIPSFPANVNTSQSITVSKSIA